MAGVINPNLDRAIAARRTAAQRLREALGLTEDTLTVPQVVELLGLSHSTVYSLIYNGSLPAVKAGHYLLLARADVEAYDERRRRSDAERYAFRRNQSR